jgi:hypothetical protein
VGLGPRVALAAYVVAVWGAAVTCPGTIRAVARRLGCRPAQLRRALIGRVVSARAARRILTSAGWRLTTMKTDPWKCTKCRAVVFIPDDSGIEGGVCTQKERPAACAGEIERMSADEAAEVRELMAEKSVAERPWLTLVFASEEASHG